MTRHRSLAVAFALVVLLAACGGGDDSATEADADATTTEASAGSGDRGDDPATDDDGDAPGDDPTPAEGSTPGEGPAVPSSGCDTAPHGPVVDERVDTTSGGVDRWYLVTAPEDEEPLPLVVDIHGLMEGAQVHTLMSGLGAYGQEQGFVTAFPHGTGEPVAWDIGGAESPDLAFIDLVVEQVTSSRCIDTSRIYATGLSMGAFMTSLLACERADTFAAFAPVNGVQMPATCEPARPVPLLAFHGTADPILLFNGGVDTSSFTGGGGDGPAATLPPPDLDGEGYPATMAQWADVLGCTDPVDEASGPVTDRTWTCPGGAALEFVILEGQGHAWPGSEFGGSIEEITGPQVDGIDANERIWTFFQGHRLPDA